MRRHKAERVLIHEKTMSDASMQDSHGMTRDPVESSEMEEIRTSKRIDESKNHKERRRWELHHISPRRERTRNKSREKFIISELARA